MDIEPKYFEPVSVPERELPARRFEIFNLNQLDTEQLSYWRQVGYEFLSALDPDSFYSRFGRGKPADNQRLEDEVDKFLHIKDKRSHFMIGVLDDENNLMAAASMIDLSNYAPSCAEISFTVLKEYQGKGLGTALIQTAKDWLVSQDYGHVYGYFEHERVNKHVFNKVLGEPLVGNAKDGYYWRIVEYLNKEQRIAEAAIKTYYENSDIYYGDESVSQSKKARKHKKNRIIRQLYKVFKKASGLATSDQKTN